LSGTQLGSPESSSPEIDGKPKENAEESVEGKQIESSFVEEVLLFFFFLRLLLLSS